MTTTPRAARPGTTGAALLLGPLLVGAAVAIALGVYGRLHTPTGVAVNLAGFSGAQAAKAWLASVSALFAVVQLISALKMYGKLSFLPTPSWIGVVHRWSGRIAFLVAVPVAVHCLYALGFQSAEPRVLIHSLLGCLFFGAFTTKMLALRKDGLPGWSLPLLGGAAFTGLIGLWLTASFWFFSTSGVHL
ncbi:MAG TPA: DUF6529 family protein [Streptosporangiaceae bacterium]|jgi:hypothetical protein